MDQFDPILDQPQSIDYAHVASSTIYRLANHDLAFDVDAKTDLQALFWPWADAQYARSIELQISDPQNDELMALVVRYYPGYQETILGSEGMIISKRLAVPLASNYDRAVLWMLECQAEGDRLMRLDVTIDWGEPLTQRIVDGLLVAQLNPGRAQGIYAQQNADSTRVFGNPQGRPSTFELDNDGHAKLTYYVLINGIVEVPLLLTISDVGEQVAWNGFLALRDAERAFQLSVEAWDKMLKTGRLWTSDPRLNRAVQAGRLLSVQSLRRLRTGMSPAARRVADVPRLVKSLDIFDLTESQNLLAHVRRVAEKSAGKLPELLPLHAKAPLIAPGPAMAWTNRAYLMALHEHLLRHPNTDLSAQHYAAVQACAEQLIRLRWQNEEPLAVQTLAVVSDGLRHAITLATLQKNSVDAVRWDSEACELDRRVDGAGQEKTDAHDLSLSDWPLVTGWQEPAEKPWHFADPQMGVTLAGEVVWTACGLKWRRGELWVYPQRANPWRWWALLNLPLGDDKTISLVWDGETLHATGPVRSDRPVQSYQRIRTLKADELDFDLHFEMTPAQDGQADPVAPAQRQLFHPTFDHA